SHAAGSAHSGARAVSGHVATESRFRTVTREAGFVFEGIGREVQIAVMPQLPGKRADLQTNVVPPA
ncbi:MAG: hypothetical protein ACRDUX_28855, partial [Mycobacterium sp.]